MTTTQTTRSPLALTDLKPNQTVRLTTPGTDGAARMIHTGTVVTVDGASTITLRDVAIYDPELTIGEPSSWYVMDELCVGFVTQQPVVGVVRGCAPDCHGSCCHDYS